jgi:hypothetical protein
MKNKRLHVPIVMLALLTALGVLSMTFDARADDASADEHAKRARVAYDLQDWDKSIHEYQAAYQAEQRPEFLWALAQAQRMGGDYKAAIDSYKAFKRLDVSTTQANAAELQITKCEALEAKKEAEAAKAANRAKPAPTAEAKTPTTAPKPTKHEEQPAAPDQEHWYSDAFGHILFFTGLAVSGVGGYFLLTGNSDVRNTSGGYDEVTTRQDSGKKKQVIGTGGLAVGGALMVGGIVRYLVVGNGQSPPERDRQPAVGLAVLPGQAAVSVSGHF